MKAEIIEGLSFAAYKEIDAVNMSLLSAILDSPGALDHLRRNPWIPTPAAIRGGGIDCLALESDLFPRQYTTAPQRPEELPDHFVATPEGYTGGKKVDKLWRADQEELGNVIHKPADWNGWGLKLTTGAGTAWKEWAESQGLRILNHTDMGKVQGAAASVLAYELAAAIIDADMRQVTLVWQDVTGLWCKGRPDLYIHEVSWELHNLLHAAAAPGTQIPPAGSPFIPDLKSTGISAHPDTFSRQTFNQGWHRQLAHYCNGAEAITGRAHDFAGILAVEQDAPHRPEVFTMPLSILSQGRMEVRAMLDLYKECEDRNEWNTGTGKVQSLEFQPWMTR
ncbi:MAG: PD-(D/E)XK nuclease-like domain-containing protein [Dehalococcoidales bacterium]